jgi:hypothetical protein
MGNATSRAGSGGPDPEQVQTLPELALALDQLRGTRSYKDLNKAAAACGGLPGSTVSNLLNGKSMPGRDTVVAFLTACGLNAEAQVSWLAAWERVSTRHLHAPAGAVRVRQARPRLLGVHAAIQVKGADGELPSYVPRDLDADLRTAVTAAADSGGFVLLVGGSSVGKTRTLWEAVRTVMAEWWLLHPADTAALEAFAAQPTQRTVVWLDELQRFLGPSGSVSIGSLRAALTAGVVVVATLWPDEYNPRIRKPSAGQPDPYANDRALLGLAHVLRVPETLSKAERRRAAALNTDPRIRIALDSPDAGFTQVLAAGPALITWWETAPDEQCYGKAVITAALDARRVGARAPLARQFLAAAAPTYLTPAQQATAPPDWLDQALTYGTTPLHGAGSTLIPVPTGMGRIGGYTVADYLHQYARRLRRTVALPDQVWQALADHHHPDDTVVIAGCAERRDKHQHAEFLYRHAADAGNWPAARWLAGLLENQGEVDDAVAILHRHIDSDNWDAMYQLACLLTRHRRLDRSEEALAQLRRAADAGHRPAAGLLATLLAEPGGLKELRQRADSGDHSAQFRLAHLLDEQG